MHYQIEPYCKVSLGYGRHFKMADRHFEPCVWAADKTFPDRYHNAAEH